MNAELELLSDVWLQDNDGDDVADDEGPGNGESLDEEELEDLEEADDEDSYE